MKGAYVYVPLAMDLTIRTERAHAQFKTYYENLIYFRFKLNLASCKILIRRPLSFKDKFHIKITTNDVEYISSLSGCAG